MSDGRKRGKVVPTLMNILFLLQLSLRDPLFEPPPLPISETDGFAKISAYHFSLKKKKGILKYFQLIPKRPGFLQM